MYHRRLVPLLVASLLAGLVCRPALAQAPTIDRIAVDLTFVNEALSAACGFDIVHHVEGEVTVFTYANAPNPVGLGQLSVHRQGSS